MYSSGAEAHHLDTDRRSHTGLRNSRSHKASAWEYRPMSDHTYRVIEVVGSSSDGTDAAIANAIARVTQTTRNVEWFEVVSTAPRTVAPVAVVDGTRCAQCGVLPHVHSSPTPDRSRNSMLCPTRAMAHERAQIRQ